MELTVTAPVPKVARRPSVTVTVAPGLMSPSVSRSGVPCAVAWPSTGSACVKVLASLTLRAVSPPRLVTATVTVKGCPAMGGMAGPLSTTIRSDVSAPLSWNGA